MLIHSLCVLLCLLRHQYITIAGLAGGGYCFVVFRVRITCKELATATQLTCPSYLNAGLAAVRMFIAGVTTTRLAHAH